MLYYIETRFEKQEFFIRKEFISIYLRYQLYYLRLF